MPKKDEIIDALQEVMDPELMINVWTLELIYDIKINGSKVDILMTFTTPLCPYGEQLKTDITNRLKDVEGVEEVSVEVTFEPKWEPTEELRALFGV